MLIYNDMKPTKEQAIAVNKLFILASLQENIILSMPDQGLKHEIKQRFNRIHSEVTKLNAMVNSNLADEELEGFDLITDAIEQLFDSMADDKHIKYAYIAAAKYGVLVADILKKARTQPLVEARQYAVWLTKNNTSLSLNQIGKLFNIHYSTVIYAVKNINGLIEVNQLMVQ